MFANAGLAARVERAEAAVGRAMATPHVGSAGAPGAFVRELAGGGIATFVRPASPMNKVLGAGLDAPIDAGLLAELEAAFHARGEPVRVEVATVAAPETHAALTARGYQLAGFEYVLAREVDADLAAGDGAIAIEAVADAAGMAAYRDAVVEGFLAGDGTGALADTFTRDIVTRVFDDMLPARGFARYLARRGGATAGGASMLVTGDIAALTGSATLPAHRRRGVQAALLARRLADARTAGAALAIITTAPGSQSQANVMKLGFALLYARAILVLAPPPT